jgi:lipopolysaccharide/colanic/teichoic acid biosynthesis glycosyltransferase
MSDAPPARSGRAQAQNRLSLAPGTPPIPGSGGASGYHGVKAALDWVAALVLLICAAPLLAALAILLKLTSEGPVIYTQVRLGRFGAPFRILKLRTMTHGCEAITGPVWSIADDPRVTKVGQWLRGTHLDELPQLWNVLRGEMSLIGPRPERPDIAAHIERSLPEFRERLMVRPGITGLAQIRLPADSDLDTVRRKLAHDRHYVWKMGPALDARIAISTALYLVGAAITAASRQLVRAFAPPPAAEPPAVLTKLGLSGTDRGFTGPAASPDLDELSRAA